MEVMEPFRTSRAVDVLNGFGESPETVHVEYRESEPYDETPKTTFCGDAELTEADVMKAFREQDWGTILSWAAFSPEAVGNFQGVHMKIGVSALHYGILFNAPVDVVGSLIYACPELPRRRATERIATEEPMGDLPIHWAARVGSSVEIFKCLLDADPLCGFVRTGDTTTGNESAMSMLWNRHNEGLLEASKLWNKDSESFSSHMERTQSPRSLPWTKMMMLLQYGYNAIHQESSPQEQQQQHQQQRHTEADTSENEESNFLPLHAAVSLCDEPCLLPFVECLLDMNPPWIKSPDTANGGIIPLTAAAKSTQNQRVRLSLLKLLLNRWSKGAHVRDTEKGRLPLTWAVSAAAAAGGVARDDDNEKTHYNTWLESGLEELFRANPEAVSEKDKASGLYPFMLAALSCEQPTRRVPHACTPIDLTAAYKLLLADPSCLSAC